MRISIEYKLAAFSPYCTTQQSVINSSGYANDNDATIYALFSVCIPVGGGTPGISLCEDGEQDQDVAEDADGGDDVHQHQPGTHLQIYLLISLHSKNS